MKTSFAALVLSALALSVHALPSYPYSSFTDCNYTTTVQPSTHSSSSIPSSTQSTTSPPVTTSPTVPPECCDSTVPLFRAYQISATDHFYTTNATERDIAVARLNYTNEGTAAQVFPAAVSGAERDHACGSVPFYRLYQPSVIDHFYTTDAQERDNAVTLLGYSYEGVAGYVNPVKGAYCY
ncbi:uncharacterized protein BXZ73DRAFT_107015 [Epithele typhae]|uniref:uncharacterized protein n=1 Tax=Epithele typhae TaxID=378194 RepID=UPI0020074196|nr:uncharacterized protein BXZ73DRAFT_107015 [Epithele typhae]KAH9913140.1 hypothetical protein BXZ73DRAFT_107015 [Epithele typhae]